MIATGIAWDTDKNVKFKNPSMQWPFNGTERPINWTRNVADLGDGDPSNSGYENEDLIVWMRTAALPNFRKLYRRVNHSSGSFASSLPNGTYHLTINYSMILIQ